MQQDDEEQLLRSVALQNMQSILQARQRAEQELLETKEALEEERRILELLNETGMILATKLDLPSAVQAVTDAATALSGAQFGAFFHTSSGSEGDAFTLYALSGAPRAAFENLGHPRATPIFASTFRGEGVIRMGDVRKDPRYGQLPPHFGMPSGHLPVCSYMAVPVVSRSSEVLGGLFFGHQECDVFTERSERLIKGIAGQAAIAIDNARLYEEAKRSAEERAELLEAERLARAESERVNLMKDEFLATLSHELRTPLSAVLGWADLLLSKADKTSDARRGLEAIARNARTQAKLIDDLLDMNGIASGKLRLDLQPVELASIVETALDSIRPATDSKAITLEKHIGPNAGAFFGDRTRLQQVVWNLLTNAVKFTPKGGKIEIFVKREDATIEIVVRDSGIGINADFLPYLFERFRQADSSITRKYGGLGLGLSIVRQLVEFHGGHVTAHSAGEGQGSTFVISLPVREPSALQLQQYAGTGHSAAVASLSGMKILVVDDERDARELIEAVVSTAGARVVSAASAQEGLALAQAQRPDVIVCDIGMPDRDGYSFIRDLRSRSALAGGLTPAIALTAFARSEDRARSILAGYQIHLAKPVEPQTLVAAIREQMYPTR